MSTELPVAFTAADAADLGKMLRSRRAGHLSTSHGIASAAPVGSGKYDVKLVRTTDEPISADTPLASPQLGEALAVDPSVRFVGLNLSELDGLGSSIDVGTRHLAVIHRRQDDAIVVVFSSGGALPTGQ